MLAAGCEGEGEAEGGRAKSGVTPVDSLPQREERGRNGLYSDGRGREREGERSNTFEMDASSTTKSTLIKADLH